MLVLSGCQTRASAGSHDGTMGSVRGIALSPVRNLVNELFVPESLLVVIDSTLESRVRLAGFGVLPASTYQRVWDEMLAAFGPFYDPLTGARNDSLFGLARDSLYTHLQFTYQVEAVLYAELVSVTAVVDDGRADWDGARQSLVGWFAQLADGILQVLEAIADGESESTLDDGEVEAMSLGITIEDQEGAVRYERWAGVEVIADHSTGSRLPDGKLFRSPGRYSDAAVAALGDLVHAGPR